MTATLLGAGLNAAGVNRQDDDPDVGAAAADVRGEPRGDRGNGREPGANSGSQAPGSKAPTPNDPEPEPPDWVRPSPSDISDVFGPRDWRGGEMHDGMDFAANEGEPNYAAGAGTVIDAGPDGGYGNVVRIDHGNGIVTVYGHHSELSVSPGDKVKPGDKIGLAGSTGDITGPHLHFEVHVDDSPIDPQKFLEDEGVSF